MSTNGEGNRPLFLALGGGAARGAAHLGVLHELDCMGIRPRGVAGTSVGAAVAAAYAMGWSPKDLLERMRTVSWRSLVTPSFRPLGESLLSTDRWRSLLRDDLGLRRFSDLSLPLAVVATDLTSGTSVVLDGRMSDLDLTDAILASSAVPGIFPPVEAGSRCLVDGGLMNNLPVSAARGLAAKCTADEEEAFVVSVDLMAYPLSRRLPVGLFDTWQRSLWLMLRSNQGNDLGEVVIRPEIGEFSFSDLSMADALFDLGARAAHKALPAIAAARATSSAAI